MIAVNLKLLVVGYMQINRNAWGELDISVKYEA